MNYESFILSLNFEDLHLVNELTTRHISRKVIKPGDVVLDLGANSGYHSTDMAAMVTNTGLVHMFEPNPDLWPALLAIPNARLWPFAAGDRISIENFYLPKDLDQVGSLINPSDFITAVEIDILSVVQITLDSLQELINKSISFVKIDVERREEQAICGMIEIINNSRPIIVFENNNTAIDNILISNHYTTYDMLNLTIPEFKLANVIAIPDEKNIDLHDLLPDWSNIDTILIDFEDIKTQYNSDYKRIF